MKDEFINFIATIIVAALIIIGCTKNSDPISVASEIDTKLVGEWLIKDSLSMSYPAPQKTFYGIQITHDKTIMELGIEIKTGKVAILNNSKFVKLIKANDGMIVVEVFAPPGLVTDTMYYVVKEKELYVSDGYLEKTYQRTNLGNQVCDPISFVFTVMIDSAYFKNIEVYSYLSSFASRLSSSDLLITALIPNAQIEIVINNFNGIGTYPILFEKGKLIFDGGDYFLTYLSDSINTGTISINNYSEVENICTGTFSFDAIRLDYINNTAVIVGKKLEEGSFSFPVYK